MCCNESNPNVKYQEFIEKLEILASEYGYHVQTIEDKKEDLLISLSNPFSKKDQTSEDIPEEIKEYLCVDIMETNCSSVIIRS